jgi:glucose-1-phosphate adenylyltransferase
VLIKKHLPEELAGSVASIVLAGGQGTRLFPLTRDRCKPAVAFGGRYRLIDIPLSNSLNSQIFQVAVISQYFASDLNDHILSTYRWDQFRSGKLNLLCPEETPGGPNWFKGTADAVRRNLHHLLEFPVEYFLILSGDQLYNIDFQHMLAFAIRENADLVIASLPVGQPEAKRMGLLKLDGSSKVVDFFEKPQDQAVLSQFQLSPSFLQEKTFIKSEKPHYLGSMGIYIFKRQALISALKSEGDDFGKHIIPAEVKKGKTFAFMHEGYWEDIGTIRSYYDANLALTAHRSSLDMYDEENPIFTSTTHLPSPLIKESHIKDSLISQGAIIEAKEISHSIIGLRSHIKKGTVIKDSIIMGNPSYEAAPHHPQLPAQFFIGEHCLIQKAIIDECTCIGNGVQLINKDRLQTYDGDGIYIRDGIIIVTKGKHLPEGFIL